MCETYNFKLFDIIFPPTEILFKICVIRDKTKLFLSSLLRIIFYYLLLDFLMSYGIATYQDNQNDQNNQGIIVIKQVIFYMFIILLILNICLLILVLFKFPAINESSVVKEVDTELNTEFVDHNSSLVTRSLGRTETEKVFDPDIMEVPGRLKTIS
jgi:hypothetical protein